MAAVGDRGRLAAVGDRGRLAAVGDRGPLALESQRSFDASRRSPFQTSASILPSVKTDCTGRSDREGSGNRAPAKSFLEGSGCSR